MKCHNCGKATNLYVFLKDVDLSLYRSYVLEKFNNKKIDVSFVISEKHPIFEPKTKPIGRLLESIAVLPDEHWVMQYIRYRKIPMKYWTMLYYSEDFKSFVDEILPNHDKKLVENDPRLVIPFYDEDNNITGFQGRTLNNNNAKYITIKLNDDGIKLYGLERIKKDQQIQVVEGPIDSLFLPNSVATCDSDLTRSAKYICKDQLLIIWDNQYENKDVHRSMTKAIDDGFSVVVFPKYIKEKDINDLVISGRSQQEILDLINANTYSGLRAKLELQNR